MTRTATQTGSPDTVSPDLVLATKLHRPRPRADLAARPRLVARLDTALAAGCRLILLSAPAGYGKTTLLVEWLAGQPAVAWVSLDAADNDPSRFLRHLLAALEAQRPGATGGGTALLAASALPPVEAIFSACINGLAASPERLVIALDDYHLIEASALHAGLAFFLEHLPAQVHLVIAGRADPPLGLARLRVRGQLCELSAEDLRFTSDEAAAFLNKVAGLGLAAAEIATLETRTEGWIAGLQLAALSMKNRADRSGFVRAFSGSQRYVLEYLVEEVLARQPADIQAFLLQTSVLERMCGPLCDAVVGISESANQRMSEPVAFEVVQPPFAPSPFAHSSFAHSQAILEQLERANAFLVPLDDQGRWYRYHHFFAEALQRGLARTPGLPPAAELHGRASAWFERNGLLAEALRHAAASADWARAAGLVETHAAGMLMRSELGALLSWLGVLPEAEKRGRPYLAVVHAWALLLSGQFAAVAPCLSDAEANLDRYQPTQLVPDLRSHIDTIRACLVGFLGEIPAAIALSQAALARLAPGDHLVRSVAAVNLGYALALAGDWADAWQALQTARAEGEAAGNVYATMLALGNLGEWHMRQGRLREAQRFYEELIARAGRNESELSPAVGFVYVGMGGLRLERNELAAAAEYLERGIELCGLAGDFSTRRAGFLSLARVRQAQGRVAEARAWIEKAVQIAGPPSAVFSGQAHAHRARLAVAQGDLAQAAAWSEICGLSPRDEVGALRELEHLTLARILLAQGRPEGVSLLSRVIASAEAGGRLGHLIEALALQAVTLAGAGQHAQGLAALRRTLALGAEEGYLRTFLDLGEPLDRLLRQLREIGGLRAGLAGYSERLLAAFARPTGPASDETRAPSPLAEPLTPRELEILRLIAGGASNREIAERLVITVGTVKIHINRLLGKLAARNRTEAVARAREAGVLAEI